MGKDDDDLFSSADDSFVAPLMMPAHEFLVKIANLIVSRPDIDGYNVTLTDENGGAHNLVIFIEEQEPQVQTRPQLRLVKNEKLL